MHNKKYLYLILTTVFLIMFSDVSFAINVNEPPDYVNGSWGMIIFAFVTFVFIIPAIIDFKQKREDEYYKKLQEPPKKTVFSECQKKYIDETLKRLKYLKSFDGQRGCLKIIYQNALSPEYYVPINEVEFYEKYFKDSFINFDIFYKNLYSKPEILQIKQSSVLLNELIRDWNNVGYINIIGQIDEIIEYIEKL